MNATTTKPPRALHPRTPDVKYTGIEPEWRTQPTGDQRAGALIGAFTWYGYHYGKKEAKEFVLDWLTRADRKATARDFARVPEAAISAQIGWLARMSVMGLELTQHEQALIDSAVAHHLTSHRTLKQISNAEDVLIRPTIQDRLRDRMVEAAAELESMYDDMIQAGARMSADRKPMAVLRGLNVAPQMIGEISQLWKSRLAELEEAMQGRDAQLAEGYAQFGKQQLKSLAKFSEQVIADCGSYVQIKKVERKPRKKKPVSAERLTQKFRHLAEFAELQLRSVAVTGLVDAQEAWLFDTKKRRLIHVVADPHVGSFTVKNNSLIGFDTANSVQKILRKPQEQLKALLSGGAAQARKVFKEIRATQTQFNGRGNDNMVLLRAR